MLETKEFAMDTICYVCSKESADFRRNFAKTRTQCTNTPISRLIRIFLGDFESVRNVDDESNCICVECLQQFDNYDRICQHAVEQKTKLRDLLWSSEAKIIEMKEAVLNETNEDTEIDQFEANSSNNSNIEIIEPMSPMESVSNSNRNLNDDSVRRNLVSIRLVKRGTAETSTIDPLNLNHSRMGTLIKIKNGRTFRIKTTLQSTQNSASTTVPAMTVTRQTVSSKTIDNSLIGNAPTHEPFERRPCKIRRICEVCSEVYTNKRLFLVSEIFLNLLI